MGFHFALSTLAAALWFASALSVSRAIGEKLATDRFSPLVWGPWLALVAGGAVGLSRVKIPLLFALGAWLLACVALTGSAVEVRGSEPRRKLAVSQLYLVVLALSYALLRSLGLSHGASASAKYEFAVHGLLSELTLPLFSLLGAPAADAASAAVFWAAQALSQHLFAATALSSFACAAFAVAYLAARPLPAPGVDLLPLPSVASLLFLASSLAALLLPKAGAPHTIATFVSATLLPFFVAEGAFAVQRLLQPVRVRLLLVALLLALGLLFPAIVVAIAVLGVLAQVLRLRELLPFNRLADAPIGRPRPAHVLGWFAGFAALGLLSSLSFQHSLAKHTRSLSARADLCGGLETQVTWQDSTVQFTGPGANFTMDVEEIALPARVSDASSAADACTARGKRLCSIDEWYAACLCTYPGDAETGMKLQTNYALAARLDRERSNPKPSGAASTMVDGKQSEVRGLLGARSELVQNPAGGGVLVAGPAELMAEPWTVDCRHRTLLTDQALAGASREFVGLRCCSGADVVAEKQAQ